MKLKILASCLALLFFLSGCGQDNAEMDRAMALRSKLNAADGFGFDAQITADLGERTYTFAMECRADSQGDISFTVTKPETIAGISGKLSSKGGEFTFEGTALAFELLADDRLSPISAPWLLVHTLQSGYLSSCAKVDNGLLVCLEDSYEDDALKLNVYLGENDLPTGAEVFCDGQRILSIAVNNFAIQ